MSNSSKIITLIGQFDAVLRLAGIVHNSTDTLFSPELAKKQGKQLAKLTRWYSPFEVLKMATSDNAALLAMSGPRNPYTEGALGVVKAGAYADLVLVDGNPLENIKLIVDPARNFTVIMKDGKIYKNTDK